eukprot:Lithocolla_globosa_v1_NODE_4887_length_1345_cov_4.520930.p3 type:complete len:118 gc:universal NODE_4887_length_1345_cov_4.520930:414-61(-)
MPSHHNPLQHFVCQAAVINGLGLRTFRVPETLAILALYGLARKPPDKAFAKRAGRRGEQLCDEEAMRNVMGEKPGRVHRRSAHQWSVGHTTRLRVDAGSITFLLGCRKGCHCRNLST